MSKDEQKYSEMQCSMPAALSVFGAKSKIVLTGVRGRIPRETIYLILQTLQW